LHKLKVFLLFYQKSFITKKSKRLVDKMTINLIHITWRAVLSVCD